jgi:hypothetical protein
MASIHTPFLITGLLELHLHLPQGDGNLQFPPLAVNGQVEHLAGVRLQ